jgi:hypothetical protein
MNLTNLDRLSAAATKFIDLEIDRYKHGGGRIYTENLGGRTLVADLYDEANREHYMAFRELEPKIRAVIAAAEELTDTRTLIEEQKAVVELCEAVAALRALEKT